MAADPELVRLVDAVEQLTRQLPALKESIDRMEEALTAQQHPARGDEAPQERQ